MGRFHVGFSPGRRTEHSTIIAKCVALRQGRAEPHVSDGNSARGGLRGGGVQGMRPARLTPSMGAPIHRRAWRWSWMGNSMAPITVVLSRDARIVRRHPRSAAARVMASSVPP